MTVEFKAWPKIQRNVLGDCVITEKYDGTNACIIIEEGKVVEVRELETEFYGYHPDFKSY